MANDTIGVPQLELEATIGFEGKCFMLYWAISFWSRVNLVINDNIIILLNDDLYVSYCLSFETKAIHITQTNFGKYCLVGFFSFLLTGRIPNGLKVHPDRQHLIYALGCTVVVEDIQSGKQEFLTGHSNDVTCIAVSKSGRYIASGQLTYMGFKVFRDTARVYWQYLFS